MAAMSSTLTLKYASQGKQVEKPIRGFSGVYWVQPVSIYLPKTYLHIPNSLLLANYEISYQIGFKAFST